MKSHTALPTPFKSWTLLVLLLLIDLPKIYFYILEREFLMFLMSDAKYSIDLWREIA